MKNILESETELTFDTIHPTHFQRLPVRDVEAESLRPEFKGGHDVPARSRPEIGSQKGEFRMKVHRNFQHTQRGGSRLYVCGGFC